MFDAATGKLVFEVQPQLTGDGIHGVIFTPDSRRVIATGERGWVAVVDPAAGRVLARWTAGTVSRWQSALAVSPDGRFLAVAATNLKSGPSEPTPILVYRLPEAEGVVASPPPTMPPSAPTEPGLVRSLQGPQAPAWKLSFLPDGRLVSAAADHFVRVWDVAAGKEVRRFEDGQRGPWWNAAGVLTADGAIWDLSDGRKLGAVPGDVKHCKAVSPDGRRFIFQDGDGSMHEFDTARGTRVPLFPAAANASGEFSSDGSYFLYRGGGNLTVYATDGWKPVASYKADVHGFRRMTGDLRPDGLAVLVRNDEADKASALLWDWKSGRETPLLDGARQVNAGYWSPDSGLVLVSNSGDEPAFDAATGRRQFGFVPRPLRTGEGLHRATFTPDSRRIVCVTNRIAVAEAGESNPLCIFEPVDGEAFDGTIAVSPDGRLLAAQTRSAAPAGAPPRPPRRRRSASTAYRSQPPPRHRPRPVPRRLRPGCRRSPAWLARSTRPSRRRGNSNSSPGACSSPRRST